MRDPNRINRIMIKLTQAWVAAPDMRLGQLLECIWQKAGYGGSHFGLEDDKTEMAIDQWITNGEKYIWPKTPSEVPAFGFSTIQIEGHDGVIRNVLPDQFICTGLAPSLDDIKSGKVNRNELGTIGYFRHPDGHLCESSCYDKYVNDQSKSTLTIVDAQGQSFMVGSGISTYEDIVKANSSQSDSTRFGTLL